MKKAKTKKHQRYENKTRRLSFNITERQFAEFLTLYEKSGMTAYAHFIEARVFDEKFKVIKVDKGAIDVYNQLVAFHAQFRAVGVNYNQLIKTLKSHFSEKKAFAMIHKLHQETMVLASIHKKVLALANEFKEQYDS